MKNNYQNLYLIKIKTKNPHLVFYYLNLERQLQNAHYKNFFVLFFLLNFIFYNMHIITFGNI